MSKIKVLVADDDVAIGDVMQILLEENGYEVFFTGMPSEIDNLLKKEPNIILLDIWMSGVSGKDVCERIKKDPVTKHIPVVLFSANRDTKEIAEQCGADGFIAKPFDISEIINIVKKFTS
ncbi:MAG: response regulator [Ginsengibacter sp.]